MIVYLAIAEFSSENGQYQGVPSRPVAGIELSQSFAFLALLAQERRSHEEKGVRSSRSMSEQFNKTASHNVSMCMHERL